MTESPRCKVDYVTDRYSLDATVTRYGSLDERLSHRWVGADGAEPEGYRSLADWFNRHLLKTVYDERGRKTLGRRLESDYEALTGDDDLVREEVLDDLRDDGIDAGRLVDDMVSWSSMRRHLQECLDAEKPSDESATDWERESVAVAKDVVERKVDEALRSLETKGRLPGADRSDVELQVLLSCPECPTRIPFADAVERGFVCDDHLGIATPDRPR